MEIYTCDYIAIQSDKTRLFGTFNFEATKQREYETAANIAKCEASKISPFVESVTIQKIRKLKYEKI